MASSQFVIPPIQQSHMEEAGRTVSAFRDSNRVSGTKLFSTLDDQVGHRDPKSTAIAVVVNGLIAAAVVALGAHKVAAVMAPHPEKLISYVAPVTAPPPPPKALPKAIVMGGGGGQPMPRPVTRGNPPKFEAKPVLIPVAAPPKIEPRLAVEPTLNVQPNVVIAKTNAPALGMPTGAPNVAVSMGNGAGAGLGAGSGNGLGAGTGGNYGGGVFKVGGGVLKPEVISAPQPAFTEEARAAKVQGNVVVYLQVSPQGLPMHVRVVKGLGMGLDEKALEAVRQYRFKPATKDGHPVTVEMSVDVNFQII